MPKITGIIYLITNLVNNKIYVGQTRQKLTARFHKHCYIHKNTIHIQLIQLAIKKYGRENFIIEQIDSCDNEDILSLKELLWIDYLKSSYREIGYNIDHGILHGRKLFSEETKRKIGNVWLGRKHTEESKKKVSEKALGHKRNLGHKHSEETKKKMSLNNGKGRAIITSHDAALIKVMLKVGLSIPYIAEIFDVSQRVISNIKYGKTWID